MAVFNIFMPRRRHPIYDKPIEPHQPNSIETYRNNDFKVRNVGINDNAETVMFEYSLDGNIKYIEISFMVLQKLIEGKFN